MDMKRRCGNIYMTFRALKWNVLFWTEERESFSGGIPREFEVISIRHNITGKPAFWNFLVQEYSQNKHVFIRVR